MPSQNLLLLLLILMMRIVLATVLNSKLVEIVTVANVDDEDCVDNSFLQIWELRFCHKAKFLFRL